MTDAASGVALVLGIDGGNSKVDLALADARGRLRGAVRGPTVSHQAVGLTAGMAQLSELTARLMDEAGSPPTPDIVVATVAGADYPEDVRKLERSIRRLNLGREVVVLNDTFGALRAGATAGWGVGLVCGQGINAGAISPDGAQARFPGVGDVAGDWGGGGGISMAALQASVRGSDGRGARTELERAVPRFFGVETPAAMTRAFYFGTIPESRINSLAPLVFEVAAAGDEVARSIIDRLADELSSMAGSLIRRLHMTQLEVEVVLAGGVFRATEPDFYARLDDGIRRAAPHARTIKLDAPPVAGAVLLGSTSSPAAASRPHRTPTWPKICAPPSAPGTPRSWVHEPSSFLRQTHDPSVDSHATRPRPPDRTQTHRFPPCAALIPPHLGLATRENPSTSTPADPPFNADAAARTGRAFGASPPLTSDPSGCSGGRRRRHPHQLTPATDPDG